MLSTITINAECRSKRKFSVTGLNNREGGPAPAFRSFGLVACQDRASSGKVYHDGDFCISPNKVQFRFQESVADGRGVGSSLGKG
jgi:hypothetical protein